MKNMILGIVALVVGGLMAAQAQAALSINVGTVNLLPNQSGQEVTISVVGGDPVTDLEFDIEVGDGMAGPVIESIDLKTGTIFSAASFTQTDVVNLGRQAQSTIDGSPAVAASGLIATVTFDTTGISEGQFDLDLTGVAEAFSTYFLNNGNPVELAITNGTITVPEPTAAGLLAIGGLAVLRRRRRQS